MRMALASLTLLSACATTLPAVVERPGEIFDVRYDAEVQSLDEVNAVANAHCANGAAGFVSQETRYDSFTYRTYRCAFR